MCAGAVLQLENSYNALLVALDANQDEQLLPPEGFIAAGPITPEGNDCLSARYPLIKLWLV